ncbi:MAG: hypothetical protein U0414_10630 [Polyangiaceae bacterium]
MRANPLLTAFILSLCWSGCATLSTKGWSSGGLRLWCEARSSAETTTFRATLFAAEAGDLAQRLDLADADRLSIRGGGTEVDLRRHVDARSERNGESTSTYAYEASIPTDRAESGLELGFARGETDAIWTRVPMPAPPELALTKGERQHLAWSASSSGSKGTLAIFVACDAPHSRGQEDVNAPPAGGLGAVASYAPPEDAGGIDVDTLLSLARTTSAPNVPADWSGCASLSVVVVRAAMVELPAGTFGRAECGVEASRAIRLPRGEPPPTAPADSGVEAGQ